MAIACRRSPQFGIGITFLLCFALFLFACANPFNKGGDPNKPALKKDEAFRSIKPFLRLSGSNTIGAELAPALVEAWLQKQGATDIQRHPGDKENEIKITAMMNGELKMVEIKAHGSATGFVDLQHGACDIAMASRKIKPEERASLESLNLGDEKVIGLDAIVIILHESNGVTAMTKQQVKAIFTGQDRSRAWHVNARNDQSGTFDTFKDQVLGTSQLDPNAKRFEDSRALASAVAGDPDGVGFVAMSFATGVKKLQIQEKGALPVEPTVLTVKNESYPLNRRLLFYVPREAKSEARQFSVFAISEAGQDIVDKIGFVGQSIVTTKPDPNRQAAYTIPGAEILSSMIYFRSGSSELDPKALQDLPRVVALLSKQDARRGVILAGFADNKGGSEQTNLELSKRRARTVADKLAPLGIRAQGVTGFGQALPIGDNSTEDGRSKNRRVEIWLR